MLRARQKNRPPTKNPRAHGRRSSDREPILKDGNGTVNAQLRGLGNRGRRRPGFGRGQQPDFYPAAFFLHSRRADEARTPQRRAPVQEAQPSRERYRKANCIRTGSRNRPQSQALGRGPALRRASAAPHKTQNERTGPFDRFVRPLRRTALFEPWGRRQPEPLRFEQSELVAFTNDYCIEHRKERSLIRVRVCRARDVSL